MLEETKRQRFVSNGSWPLGRGWPIALFLLLAVGDFVVFAPALQGPFISDDYYYIVDNPFTEKLDWGAVAAVFDPGGAASLYVVNYAPLHLLAHGAERFLFGTAWLTPYHVINVLLHALNAVLLVALLRRSGVSALGALAAAGLFSFHPAGVEAVAWISQLKTQGSLALGFGALLAFRRLPALSVLLFAMALLFKASALFVLPMAAAFAWAWHLGRRHGVWLGVWLGVALLYAVPQFAAFQYGGHHVEPAFADPWVQLRTIAAIGTRYLVMAATSYGVSPLQEPDPALSLLDPWWLASIPIGAFLVWRLVASLRERSCEAAWWLGAAAAFAPISQVFPFIYPMADRYLYTILPGLLGGMLLAARGISQTLRERGQPIVSADRIRAALVVAWAAALVFFAVRSHDNAGLWAQEMATLSEAAARYPAGISANYLRARDAAARGDARMAIAALAAAVAQSEASHRNYYADPGLQPLREDPVFLAYAREQAGARIAFARDSGYATQHWLRVIAHDHLLRNELEDALAAFEQALRARGPRDDLVLVEVEATREMVRAQRRGEPVPRLFNLPGSSSPP